MNLFIKKIFIFLTPIIVVFFVIEVYARFVPSNYKYKRDGLLKNSDKVEILILGNSHAAYALNPSAFEKYAFNFAQVGQSIYFDKRITLKYIDNLKKLKYVFISVDYHTMYFSDQYQRNYWSYYAYGVEYKDKLDFWKKNIQFLGYSPRVLIKQFKNQFGEQKNYNRAIDIEDDVDANAPLDKGCFYFIKTNIRSFNDSAFFKRATYFNDIVSKSKEHENVMLDLDEFITILKSKNITPILITTPCYSPYRSMLRQDFLNRNNHDILKLMRKHNINFWNYFDLELDDSCYYNCDHLNYEGSKVFTRIVNAKFKEKFKD